MPAPITMPALIAVVNAATREEKVALREALKVGPSPESAAASEAYVGKGYPCTASPVCGRFLRTAARAAIHGVDAGGHTAAK